MKHIRVIHGSHASTGTVPPDIYSYPVLRSPVHCAQKYRTFLNGGTGEREHIKHRVKASDAFQ